MSPIDVVSKEKTVESVSRESSIEARDRGTLCTARYFKRLGGTLVPLFSRRIP